MYNRVKFNMWEAVLNGLIFLSYDPIHSLRLYKQQLT